MAISIARVYRTFWRRPIWDWGAQPDEMKRRSPGDELLEAADVVATRAITMEAPPSAIWPWLVQMGPGRGGAYTYDWIENLSASTTRHRGPSGGPSFVLFGPDRGLYLSTRARTRCL